MSLHITKESERFINHNIGDVAECKVDLRSGGLYIILPLLETVGLSPISPSIICNPIHSSTSELFGSGSRLNYYQKIGHFDSEYPYWVETADYSFTLFNYNSEGNAVYNSADKVTISKVYDDAYQLTWHYEMEDKYGNYLEYGSNSVKYPRLIKYKTGERYSLDFVSTTKSISNNKGDVVKFSGSPYIETVQYYHNGVLALQTSITYDNFHTISSITQKDSAGNILKKVELSISSNQIIVKDSISGYRMCYVISNSKVVLIKGGYDDNYINGRCLSLVYETNKTSVMDDFGKSTNLFFSANFPRLEIDSYGNAYEMVYDKNSEKMTYKSPIIRTKEKGTNLLTSESVVNFENNGITLSFADELVDPFSEIIGSSVKKCTGTGKLTYTLNHSFIDTDSLLLGLWGKQITASSTSSKVVVALTLKNTLNNKTTQISRCFEKTTIDGHFDLLTLGLNVADNYNQVIISIELTGNASIEIGGLQLLKQKLGNFYTYDSNSNILNTQTAGLTEDFKYNASNLPISYFGVDSKAIDYEYNDYGKVTKSTTSYGTTAEYTYDDDNQQLTSKVTNHDGTIVINQSNIYTSDGRFVNAQVDSDGNITTYEFDQKLGSIKKIINALSISKEFEYFDNGMLKKILFSTATSSSGISYGYDEATKLKTITLDNGTIYEFDYDNFSNITSIKLNSNVVFRFVYNDKNQVTQEHYGVSGSYYQFIYNEAGDLQSVNFINELGASQTRFNFEYDGLARISLVKDGNNSVLAQYTYDSDGQISKVSNSNGEINYQFDNLGYLVNLKTTNFGQTIYQSFDTIHRSAGSHPESLLKANFKPPKSKLEIFNDESTALTSTGIHIVTHDGSEADVDLNKDGVIPCCDINGYNLLSYKLEVAAANPLDSGCIAFWFKPENINYYLFSTKSNNGLDFIGVRVEENKNVYLDVIDKDGVLKTIISITGVAITLKKWNYFAFTFVNRYDGDGYPDICEYTLNINGCSKNYVKQNPRIYCEMAQYPVYNIGHKFDGSRVSEALTGKVTALLITPRDYLEAYYLNKYYQISKDYIIDNQLIDDEILMVNFSQANLLLANDALLANKDIYPLQNNVTSLKGDSPKQVISRIVSSKDKDRNFNFNKVIKRYAYVADGNILSYNFTGQAMGTVIMRAFTDAFREKQYFFELINDNGKCLGLYRDANKYLCINLNGVTYNSFLTFTNGEWHTVGVSFNSGIMTVFIDDLSFTFTGVNTTNLQNLSLVVGRKLIGDTSSNILNSSNDYFALYGQIEMLTVSNQKLDGVTVGELREELSCFTKYRGYDDMGFLRKTEIHQSGNSVLSNTYNYKYASSSIITPHIAQEVIKVGNTALTTRNYTTDSLGRITGVLDEVFGTHTYEYDYRGFLTKDNDTIYEYDKNGNMTKKGSLNLTYDSAIKDRLIAIGNKSITYDNNHLGLITGYDGKSFEYEGNKLVKIVDGNNQMVFEYNHLGQRVKKTVTKDGVSTTIQYIYEGNCLITEYSSNYRIDFIYDENRLLYGFIYNGEKYFYIRDIAQNILGITSQSGEYVVSYNCNAYGDEQTITGTLATTIGTINPFRYKGYYYDVETQLFYCNSRYYSPELCRWISPDSIEYLDPQSINGLNLYIYCGNDPINMYDPSGHFPWFILLLGGLIITALIITEPTEEIARIDLDSRVEYGNISVNGPEINHKELTLFSVEGALVEEKFHYNNHEKIYLYTSSFSADFGLSYNKDENKLKLGKGFSFFSFGVNIGRFHISLNFGFCEFIQWGI